MDKKSVSHPQDSIIRNSFSTKKKRTCFTARGMTGCMMRWVSGTSTFCCRCNNDFGKFLFRLQSSSVKVTSYPTPTRNPHLLLCPFRLANRHLVHGA